MRMKELSVEKRTEILNDFEKKIAKIEMREALPVET